MSHFNETDAERRARWERDDIEQRASDAENALQRSKQQCKVEKNRYAGTIEELEMRIEELEAQVAHLVIENARLKANK